MQQRPSHDLSTPLLHGAALLIVLAINWSTLIPPQYHDLAQLIIMALLGLAAFRIVSILIAFWKEYGKYVRSQSPSDAYGSASFLSDDETRKAGFYKRSAFFLGILHRKIMWVDMPANVLIVAPARSGKSTCGIMPNLGLNPGSAIITDMKGELHQTTHKFRSEKFGHEIIGLNLPDRLKAEPACYNACAIVTDALLHHPDKALGDAWALATQLVPTTSSSSDPYWSHGGRSVIAFAIIALALIEKGKHCNLVEVRKLCSDRLALIELAKLFEKSDALGGDVAVLAKSFINMESKTPKELQSFSNQAAQAVSIFSASSRIGRISQSCSFRFRDVKRKKMSIYMAADDTAPDEMKVLGLWNFAATTEIIREQTADPVYMFCDEAARYKVARLPDILEGCAGFGLRFILVYQSLGAIDQIYGREGAQRIISQCNTQCYFGINDSGEAFRVSQALGKTTEKITSFGMTGMITENVSAHGRDLLTADEVRRLPNDRMLVLNSGERPALVLKVGNHELEPLRSEFAPNTLYGPKLRKGDVRVRIGGWHGKSGRVFGPTPKIKTKRPSLPYRKLIVRFLGDAVRLFGNSKPGTLVLMVIAISTLTVGVPHLRYERSGGVCKYVGLGLVQTYDWNCPPLYFAALPRNIFDNFN